MHKISEIPDVAQELEFDEQDLEVVEISDEAIEATDKNTQKARRRAKKESKKHQTPDEKRQARRKKDRIILGCLILVIGLLLAFPATRWPILNAIGLRGDLVITVHEQKSQEPIKGVAVALADGTSVSTDDFGHATLSDVTLGKHSVTLTKAGYGMVTKELVNGIGTTKAEVVNLKVIGIKLDVVIKDWLSAQPLAGAKVSFGEAAATSDKSGLASIIISPTDESKVTLEITAEGYMAKSLETEVAISSREVSLIAAHKNYFISKRDGKFDIFSSNLNGSDQRKIIEATGKENESLLQLSINRNNQQAILVANRDGKIQNNRIVAGIYVIDLSKATLKKVDEGSDVQLLGWVDDVMVYTKTSPDLGYDDPNFTKLQSYSLVKAQVTPIAQANYFQIGTVAQSKVFYMPADSYRSIENSVLTSFDTVNGAKRTYLTDKQLSYGTRATYGTLELQDTGGGNYELNVATGAVKNIDRQPAPELVFALKPGGGKVLWSDRRDGQGTLLIRSIGANDERIIAQVGGLTQPVRFVGEAHAVVRVVTSAETADYVVDIATGKMAKIVDVSNVGIVRGGL